MLILKRPSAYKYQHRGHLYTVQINRSSNTILHCRHRLIVKPKSTTYITHNRRNNTSILQKTYDNVEATFRLHNTTTIEDTREHLYTVQINRSSNTTLHCRHNENAKHKATTYRTHNRRNKTNIFHKHILHRFAQPPGERQRNHCRKCRDMVDTVYRYAYTNCSAVSRHDGSIPYSVSGTLYCSTV